MDLILNESKENGYSSIVNQCHLVNVVIANEVKQSTD